MLHTGNSADRADGNVGAGTKVYAPPPSIRSLPYRDILVDGKKELKARSWIQPCIYGRSLQRFVPSRALLFALEQRNTLSLGHERKKPRTKREADSPTKS